MAVSFREYLCNFSNVVAFDHNELWWCLSVVLARDRGLVLDYFDLSHQGAVAPVQLLPHFVTS